MYSKPAYLFQVNNTRNQKLFKFINIKTQLVYPCFATDKYKNNFINPNNLTTLNYRQQKKWNKALFSRNL